jgi:hypothetical protein
MATLTPEAKAIFGKTYAVPDELWLEVFFSPTETSQAAGRAFLQRLRARKENRDPSIKEGRSGSDSGFGGVGSAKKRAKRLP